MKRLLFVYGTLKRGGSNHPHLAGQTFVADARTTPGFALFDFRGFPAIAPAGDDREGVSGEVWEVEETGLQRLDEFEGVPEGLYRRAPISLQPPLAGLAVETYFPGQDVAGLPRIGAVWRE
jgi:gamma-glutamylaminecyclotransferase